MLFLLWECPVSGQEKSPRSGHSPLLEVNRTGSLLIVKSNSSNPSNDTQEQARAQRLPGSSTLHSETSGRLWLHLPFTPNRPLKRLSFPFKLLLRVFFFFFFTAPPSFPRSPSPPLFFFSLSHKLPAWIFMLHLKTIGNKAIPCLDYGFITLSRVNLLH